MINKYKEYIKLVGEGKATLSLEEYLRPEIKEKKWFKKYQAIRKNTTLTNIELSERKQ